MKNRHILKNKNIHFLGIGGIGMSGIAGILLEMGYKVSGSDVEPNSITAKLEGMGGKIYCGHSASNLPREAKALVYSSSISADNPEMAEARRRRMAIAHRAEVLGELFNKKAGIAITGTHGKTTTTSLVSVMLKKAGLDPTAVIGGEVDAIGGNARLGNGKYMVAEADESDSSFLYLEPLYTVITNVEAEHLDHFGTLARIKSAYRAFINNTKKGGIVFYNIDDENLREIIHSSRAPLRVPYSKVKLRSFGLSKSADAYPLNIKMNGFDTSFDCVCGGKALGRVSIRIPGVHNILNVLAAILIGLELGLKFEQIADAIKDFDGVKRRFQMRAAADGVMLIDDYAHHPTEIRAVIAASRSWKRRRLIAVFQPHRYSRTKFFADDFGKCFEGTDKLILTEVYAASEKAIKGVSAGSLYEKIMSNGLKDVIILKKELIADHVMKLKRPGDMIIVMGAGDIKKVADELCERISSAARLERKAIGDFKKAVRGIVRSGEPISAHTSFKIGGRAEAWFEPKDTADLRRAVAFLKQKKMPFFVIGNGSNILARDKGFGGVLIHLGSNYFKKIEFKGRTVRVGAGFGLPKLVNLCCNKGLAGLESLVGIPGTIGGSIYMNAGGWTNPIFRNIGETVDSLKVMDPGGKIRRLKKSDIKFGYRHSNLGRYIILEAALKLRRGNRAALVSSSSHFLKMKREKQVLDVPSAGCVFKNPVPSQFTCGQMIDTLGLKGRKVGGAEISARHANFIVNRGGARCKDVLALVDLVRSKVKESYGMDLDLEVKII